MPAIITSDIRVFNANQFMNSFSKKNYSPWVNGVVTSIGDIVTNSFYRYIATSNGTTGVTAPTHTSGSASDGGVDWLFVEVYVNTSFFENNLYIGIGKVDPWDNPTEDDETPLTPVDDFSSIYTSINNVLAAKRLEANVVSFGINRYDWASGTIYNQFDPAIESYDYSGVNSGTPFYVLTDENNIYKCLNNNDDAQSTSKPTGFAIDQFQTADGYVWKYMATISASDAIQFLTTGYIPVERKLSDDSSPQWNVQANAKQLSISTINVTNGGSGYTSATATVAAPTSGTTALATTVIVGGIITAIRLTVVGDGYTSVPTVTIGGDGADGAATAVLAPKDGHGANILTELNARNVIVNARFDDVEGGYFPITGESDFRQIMLLADPIDEDTSVYAIAQHLLGPSHDDYVANPNTLSRLSAGLGTLLYIENIAPVVRTSGQIEDIKIVLKF